MIEVKNLSKSFKNIKAVNNISFTVKEGEIVGLLGENGAGKTTTLRMIATMLKPTEGTVNINGFDILKDSSKVRAEIGILFGGEVGLYDRLTARENIKYFAMLNGLSEKQANENIKSLMETFEMEDYIDRKVGKFSRGMKQRVAIARSIVHNPKVMLFDEPTIGLDVTASRTVQNFIFKCKKDNKVIIFSSHSMREVEKLCDRVIIINKGNIVEEGTINDLKRKYNNDDLEEVFLSLIGGDINEK
ncbi:MAG: ATP-binding cassette domain-containing protein [Clostridium argentinense]|uniref:ATP-binding cassette domain-containing protein n=1 Tax=Clostridium faecium TaxID=2762223 RepID=A0ABR8YRE0_9CLOT|nr:MULTISPECIES: ATP-binding cassette domain-containing protein [Clostridium]MBD8046803.1 ATP-binding cassette domain-containing protein [Clostridium faecium]MBS5824498.1 ATP-binding cassette domain-containing protein [Clostridium argentinense]MDU1350482.1 ATP-binding cassette domain-containing protein [Clostridium argentinense]